MIDGGAGTDTYVFSSANLPTTDSGITTANATSLTEVGIDVVSVTTGDHFDFTGLAGSTITATVGSGNAIAVAVGTGGAETTGTALQTAIQGEITEAAGTAFLIQVTDAGTNNTFTGTYLVETKDELFDRNDFLVKLVGTDVSANDTIAVADGNVIYTVV